MILYYYLTSCYDFKQIVYTIKFGMIGESMNCCLSCCCFFRKPHKYSRVPLNDHEYNEELKQIILNHIKSFSRPKPMTCTIEPYGINLSLSHDELYEIELQINQTRRVKGVSFEGYEQALMDLLSDEGELGPDGARSIIEPYIKKNSHS